ncbi:MAG: hypothetical protein Q8P60_11145 [Pseudorhodobacter sp.]|nr:hypothetical protein [Pseudorhodobacter sp.]
MTFVIQRRHHCFQPYRNPWRGVADLTGMGGRFESESVAEINRNTHFARTCTCMEILNWKCCAELADYREAHSEDTAFQYDAYGFTFYSRNEALLKPYCLNYPNTIDKIFTLLRNISDAKEHKVENRTLQQNSREEMVTYIWHLRPYTNMAKRLYQIVFLEKAGLRRIMFILKELMMK